MSADTATISSTAPVRPGMRFDPDQRSAIESPAPAILLAAGAGSGKTATLIERAARQLEAGMDPDRLLMLTFSRKACNEMGERLDERLKEVYVDLPNISTYHAYGYQIVRTNPEACGRRPSPSLMDEPDQKRLFREAVVEFGDGDSKTLSSWSAWYESVRNIGLDPTEDRHGERIRALIYAQSLKQAQPGEITQAMNAFRAYDKAKVRHNTLDYHDVLNLPVQAFRRDPDVWKREAERYDEIIVDEAQDTNDIQYKLIQMLGSRGQARILMVGDDDQAIYGWRGARPQNLQQFQRDFQAQVITLNNNYRSTPDIVKPAARMIENNQERMPKTPVSARYSHNTPPALQHYRKSDRMAAQIAQQVRETIDSGQSPREIAILYRTNRMMRVLEPALVAKGIPYHVAQGVDLQRRTETQAVFAAVRLAINPNDYPALKKIATHIPGLGPKRLEQIVEARDAIMLETGESPGLLEMGRRIFTGAMQYNMLDWMERLEEMLYEPPCEVGPGRWARDVKGGNFHPWLERLAEQSPRPAENLKARLQTLTDIDEAITRRGVVFEQEGMTLRQQWESVMEMALSTPDEEMSADVVTLSTIHKAKGLEWADVHIAGFSEELMPMAPRVVQSDPENEDEGADGIEEERRLAYVAMTRARDRLFLHHAERVDFGYETLETRVSRFAAESGVHVSAKRIEPKPEPVPDPQTVPRKPGSLLNRARARLT